MKLPDDLGFVHVFRPGEKPASPTLLLLHGTGGDERDLLPLGRELWPGAALLGVRGTVLENGMPRFFRRFAEGVFDVDDLKARTSELAHFIDLAALQIVRDVLDPKPGMTVLIHGAAGGVGSYATQIAQYFSLRVIGTASGADIEYLESLGVDRVIDYKRERFEDKVSGLDAVIDLVGGETLARSYSVVKSGGVLATTVQPVDEAAAKQAGIGAVQVFMKRNTNDLAELARLVEEGAVKPRLSRILQLEQAKEAQGLSEKGRTHGKVILKVA